MTDTSQCITRNRFNSSNFKKYRKSIRSGGSWSAKYSKDANAKSYSIEWDFTPDKEYFDELFRVSKNQIIWGGNYFSLPGTRCFLVWRKLSISENFSMAMCEYAWTSLNENSKIFDHVPQGNAKEKRFHPTQKPTQLYEWIFRHFAKPNMKILDTHLGSGSSRIAARLFDLDFVGCELDADYFAMQEDRWKNFCAQGLLF